MDGLLIFALCGVAQLDGCFRYIFNWLISDISWKSGSWPDPHHLHLLLLPDRGHLRGSPEGVEASSASGGDWGRLKDPRFR